MSLSVLAATTAWGQEEEGALHKVLHGLVMPDKKIGYEAGITMAGQAATDSRLDSGIVGSADLVLTIPGGPGEITAYFEASSTVPGDSVAGLAPEANGDAGSAVGSNDRGRVQISEFHYTLPVKGNQLVTGLIDLPAFLDTNAVANDENSQFLSTTLVHNPTIEFPDYTLGAVLTGPLTPEFGYVLVLTGSHGLADNPERSYSELFDLNDPDKGIFMAAELKLSSGPAAWRLGAWQHDADHVALDETVGDKSNYGIFGGVDFSIGDATLGLRGGQANSDVSEAARFASAALEYDLGAVCLGAGLSHTILANDADTDIRGDMTQVEVYGRIPLAHGFEVTPSLQWIGNSLFDRSSSQVDADLLVFSLRATFAFGN